MQMSFTLLCVSLWVLSAQFSKTHATAFTAPEKRGWTLNSAGYLLGPYAQRTLTVRHGGGVGKRNRWEENISKLPVHQPSHRSLTDEPNLHSLMDFLVYLRMKENEVTEESNSSIFDEMTQ
ncbi:galanin peptides-like [Astyanax mexicanus]|uniref:galanin peptides-like n=1 Tax=Astyanax mexicanus TaxID=7994 RepID=UPI0020CAA0FE|nr:galanin peptides-like [Astyanax mexicanus]